MAVAASDDSHEGGPQIATRTGQLYHKMELAFNNSYV